MTEAELAAALLLQPAVFCRRVTRPAGFLGLDCPVVSGNSGAPVLQAADGSWQIVGVIVTVGQRPVPARAITLPP